jgi:hypothetical protein
MNAINPVLGNNNATVANILEYFISLCNSHVSPLRPTTPEQFAMPHAGS